LSFTSTYFENLVFIIRKTLLYIQPYMVCFPCIYASSLAGGKMCSIHVHYNLPDDEHKMFETCRRQGKLN